MNVDVVDLLNAIRLHSLTPLTSSACPSHQVAASLSQGGAHRLQFLMGGRPLPYDITVFQAIEQYGSRAQTGQQEDGDTASASQLFQKTHTIYYR